MEKQLTKVDYYENIRNILVESKNNESCIFPKRSSNDSLTNYLNEFLQIAMLNYDVIKNMNNDEFDKYKINREVDKNEILNFIDREVDSLVNKTFYRNLFKKERDQQLFDYLWNELSIETPYTISEMIKNSFLLEDYSNQKIQSILTQLIDKNLVEIIYNKKLTLYRKKENTGYIFKMIKNNYNYTLNDIEKFVIKQRKNNALAENSVQNERKCDKQDLIEYIQGIINIETDIISLKKRYNILQIELFNNIVSNHEEYYEIEKILENRKNEISNNIKTIETKMKKKPQMSNTIKLEKPKKPSKPEFNEAEPAEPIYLKYNIFNKKKIEKQNEEIKLNYELELKKYNDILNEHNEKLKKYEEDIIKYNEEKLICEEKELKLNKEKYEEDLNNYNIELKELSIKLEQEREKLDNLNKNYNQELEKEFSKNLEYNKIQAIIYEMDYIISIIVKNLELEKSLYSKNIIYTKYRDYVILSRFCDYLLSGRCSELEGPNGAYNIYEQEIRTDIIIEKLDKIELSLEQIKNNQIYIYNELVKINNSLDLINGQLLVNNILEVVQIDQLDNIMKNTNKIAYNTEVAAYYAEKSVNYQRNLLLLNLFNK